MFVAWTASLSAIKGFLDCLRHVPVLVLGDAQSYFLRKASLLF